MMAADYTWEKVRSMPGVSSLGCLAMSVQRPWEGAVAACVPQVANAYLEPPHTPSSSMWLAALSKPFHTTSLSEKARPTVASCHWPIKSQILDLQFAADSQPFAGPGPLDERSTGQQVGPFFFGSNGREFNGVRWTLPRSIMTIP